MNSMPTISTVQEGVGQLASALYALYDIGRQTPDIDALSYRIAILAKMLATAAEDIYLQCDHLLTEEEDQTRRTAPAAPAPRSPHVEETVIDA
jgi:hypothetical protein